MALKEMYLHLAGIYCTDISGTILSLRGDNS